MIRSNWKTRRDRLDARYRSGGDELATKLGELVAEYHVEAARADNDFLCTRLMENAWMLDAIRCLYISGGYDPDYAGLWLDAGRAHLADVIGMRVYPIGGE